MSSIDIFLDPKTLQDFCSNFAHPQHSFKSIVQSNMMTAMTAGVNRSTTSTVGQTGPNVLWVLQTLNALGYKANISGTTLTVSWA